MIIAEHLNGLAMSVLIAVIDGGCYWGCGGTCVQERW